MKKNLDLETLFSFVKFLFLFLPPLKFKGVKNKKQQFPFFYTEKKREKTKNKSRARVGILYQFF